MAKHSVNSSYRRRTLWLVVFLGVATASGTFLQGALSVLSSEVIAEFNISRSELGIVFTVFSLSGGAVSPIMGRLADRSIRAVMAGLFAFAVAGMTLAAASAGLGWLILAACIGGLGLAASNPVTNKIVSEQITQRRRGIVIGIKQAGPPLGLLAAGVALPPLTALLGWRWALAATASMPIVGLIGTRYLVPHNVASSSMPPPPAGPLDPQSNQTTVRFLAVIGMLVAMGAAGIIAFVPLFAQEEVGFTVTIAGLLAALMGLSGVAARVAWGALADRYSHASRPMIALSTVAMLATLTIWAGMWASWFLWVGVIAAGFSMLGWHSIGWLALLNSVSPSGVGKASGTVQLGNGVGFAAGPILVGILVDTFGYGAGWAAIAGIFALTVILTLGWQRSVSSEKSRGIDR